MKRVFHFFILTLLTVQSYAQGRTISRTEAIADIDSLVLWISEIHPDMFTVCSREVFDKSIQKVKAGLPDSLDQISFYLRITPCITQLGDGHTSVQWPNSGKNSRLRISPLSFHVRVRDTTLWAKGNDSIQIIAINQIPPREIIEKMLPYASGESLAFRFQRLDNLFPFLFPVLYPDSVCRVTLQKGEQRKDKIVPHLSFRQVLEMKKKNPSAPEKTEAYFYHFIAEKNAIVFTFNHFRDSERFKVFADSMFREIKQRDIKNLIIDIRKNGGGNSRIGDELLQYISQVPFAQFGKVISRVGPSPLFRRPDAKYAVDTTFIFEKIALKKLRDEPFRLADDKRVYLLISPYTFSSAASFSWAFKYFHMGTVVGEGSGGQSVTFGDLQPYTLPHSQLSGGISFKRFYQYGANDRDIHGTLPDIEIPSDKALDYVLDQLIH